MSPSFSSSAPGTFIAHEEVDWLDSDLTGVLASPHLPLEVRTSLVNIPLWHQSGCPKPDQIDVYTDGSASSVETDITPCAWAFAVFFSAQHRLYLFGHSSAQSAPPNTPFHIGEVLDDALTAEMLALCWALSWAAQHAVQYTVPLRFLYDSQSAGRGTFGAARPATGSSPHHYAPLAQFAVALRHYLNARRPLAHEHVLGHTGHLGNELCDALAKLARRSPSSPFDRCLPEWPANWAAHPLADWAWATVPGHEAEVGLGQARPAPKVPPRMLAYVAETSLQVRCSLT